jgi:hypothetical protein
MAPPPAAAPAYAADGGPHPVVEAIELLFDALHVSGADRVVLASGQVPQMFSGRRQCAMSSGRLNRAAVERIAEGLLPDSYVEALEEIGATRLRVPGFTIEAAYADDDLRIEVVRNRF